MIERNDNGRPELTEDNFRLFAELHDVFEDKILQVAAKIQYGLKNTYFSYVGGFEITLDNQIEYEYSEICYGQEDRCFTSFPAHLLWEGNDAIELFISEEKEAIAFKEQKQLEQEKKRDSVARQQKLEAARKLLREVGEL